MTTTTNMLESLTRILNEGYGDGAWHGPDMKAALADVQADAAFRRPAAGRHNIAEIALHHAYCVRAVRAQLTGGPPEPFVLDGEDWFALENGRPLSWPQVVATVAEEQRRLADIVARIDNGGRPAIAANDTLNVVLGITCHAAYHAGQIQLVKRMLEPA